MAQDLATVSGQVFDAGSKQSLPFATVIIKQTPDSTIISGTVTDTQGRFVLIGIANGDYEVEISFVGFIVMKKFLLVGSLNKIFDLNQIRKIDFKITLRAASYANNRDVF